MKRYFLGCGLVGIVSAVLLAAYLLGPYFFNLLSVEVNQKYYGFAPVLVGVVAIVLFSMWLDKKVFEPSFIKSGRLMPGFILLSGAISGSMASWVINGKLHEFVDWFVKPLYWLTVIGVPASLVVGTVYYFVRHRMRKIPGFGK